MLGNLHDFGAFPDEQRPDDRIRNQADGMDDFVDQSGFFNGIVLRFIQQQSGLERDEIIRIGGNKPFQIGRTVLARVRIRVFSIREEHHLHIHPLFQDHINPPERGFDPGRISIIKDGNVSGKLTDQAYLIGCKRGS